MSAPTRNLRRRRIARANELSSCLSCRQSCRCAQACGVGARFGASQKEGEKLEELCPTVYEWKVIKEAIELLPNLLSRAISDAKGDPYQLRKELEKIKENNFQKYN